MLDQPIDRITLRPEYGCDVPLWGGGGNLDVEMCQQLGLSADLLTADLRRALPTVEVAADLWCVPRRWSPWRRRR